MLLTVYYAVYSQVDKIRHLEGAWDPGEHQECTTQFSGFVAVYRCRPSHCVAQPRFDILCVLFMVVPDLHLFFQSCKHLGMLLPALNVTREQEIVATMSC